MPIARWSLVVTIVLTSIAMLVTSGTTLSGVQNASDTLERGQAAGLEHLIRGALRELGQWPVGEDLSEIVTAGAAEGLSYVAVVDPVTGQTAQAGRPVGGAPARLEDPAPSGVPVRVVDRLRVGFHTVARAPAAPGSRSPVGPRLDVIFEFVPIEAKQLRADAVRTFRVAAVVAFTLAALALALFQRVLRREAMAVELERTRRLASLGELSAMLAHELRDPLASLKGDAQLLATSLVPGERSRARAERVVDEAVRLEKLVDELLELARTAQLERLPRSPAGLLAEAVESLASSRILVDVSRAPSSWSLDGKLMVQALTHLLASAVRAGGPVRASVSVANELLAFEVRDGGPAIPDEEKPRIFEPFHGGRTRGTGLGLAVARRVAELHGGRISVSDGPQGGAVFRITVPPG